MTNVPGKGAMVQAKELSDSNLGGTSLEAILPYSLD
jgi:hypothetical protein